MLDVAFTIISPIFFGFLLGMYLDSKFHFKYPIWTMCLSVLGIILGIYSVCKRYMK